MRGGGLSAALCEGEGSEAEDWSVATSTSTRGSSLGKSMKRFEDLFKCLICRDFLANALELDCGHAFCSLCLRRHFDITINRTPSSSSCPMCRSPATLPSARPARLLKEIIAQYTSVRGDLIAAVKSKKGTKEEEKKEEKKKEETDLTSSSSFHGKDFLPSRPLSIPHLHGLNKARMKALITSLCKEVKSASLLSFICEGEKEAIERRYRDIVHLFNAQIGSLASSVLTLEQVVAEVKKREMAMKVTENSHKSSLSSLAVVKEKMLAGEVIIEIFQ